MASVRADQQVTVSQCPPGRIILLNGASGSGKTSIAEQLLLVLDEPWFHLPVDAINAMRSRQRTLELSPADLELVLARTRAGFHRAVAGMAAAGNNVIADHVLSERWRLLDCLAVFAAFDVVFVGVRCAPAELARRERLRGDREPGLALAQHERVHAHGRYDLECDTTHASPLDCALSIKAFLARARDRNTPRAFDELRAAEGWTTGR
jgi:chloramphenicol 3-O phosphotransferase